LTVVILATGPSMSVELADSLRSELRIVVNDAFMVAPDADALCANDRAWWAVNPEAMLFNGRRFSAHNLGRGVEQIASTPVVNQSSNSALLALHVAVTIFGAKRVLLYGLDMHGTHYFGPHRERPNTTPHRFEIFKQQFAAYARTLKHVSVINATRGSALQCFPFAAELETVKADVE
jgi:hypothetical protein